MIIDYFEEMQSQKEEGRSLIMCLLRPDDKLGHEADCDTADASDDENGPLDVLVSDIEGISEYCCVRPKSMLIID